MQTFVVIKECDFKKWVKEAIQEYCSASSTDLPKKELLVEEPIGRKEVARLLNISLVTLTDRVKKGLPSYKQGHNVYFIKSEVIEYLRKNQAVQKSL